MSLQARLHRGFHCARKPARLGGRDKGFFSSRLFNKSREWQAGTPPQFPKGRRVLSSEKAISSGAAGRYAVALFALAEESSGEEIIAADLGRLKALLDESDEFKQLVESPIIDGKQRRKAVALVAQTLSLHRLVANFIGVLAVNGRLDKLSVAITGFEKLAAAKRGEVSATVVSATALTEEQLSDLGVKLNAIAGRDVKFETEVDEELLAGLVVRIGSRVVDSSLRTKLENLKLSMKGL